MDRNEQMNHWFNYRGDAPTDVRRRLREAGATIERRNDGKVAIGNPPAPRVSNPNFLSDELADWEASQPKSR